MIRGTRSAEPWFTVRSAGRVQMFLHRSNNSRLDLNNQLTEKSERYVRECRLDHWRWNQTLLNVLDSFRDPDRQSGNMLSSWLQLKTLLELLQNLSQRSRSGTSLTADRTGAASSDEQLRDVVHPTSSETSCIPFWAWTPSTSAEPVCQNPLHVLRELQPRNETSSGCTCLCALCFYPNNLHNNRVLFLSPLNRTRSSTEVLVCGTSWDSFLRLFPQMFYSRLVSSVSQNFFVTGRWCWWWILCKPFNSRDRRGPTMWQQTSVLLPEHGGPTRWDLWRVN